MQSKICYGITLNNYALQQEKKGEKPQVHEITNQLHREDLLHREGCIRKRNEMLQSNNFLKNGPENWHKDMVIMGLTLYSRFLLFPELGAALSHQLGTVPVPVFPFSQDRSQIPDPRSQPLPARSCTVLQTLVAFSLDSHYSTTMITLLYGYLSFLIGVQAMMTFGFLPAPNTLNRKPPNNFCGNHE